MAGCIFKAVYYRLGRLFPDLYNVFSNIKYFCKDSGNPFDADIDRDPGSFDRSDHQADDPASSVKGG